MGNQCLNNLLTRELKVCRREWVVWALTSYKHTLTRALESSPSFPQFIQNTDCLRYLVALGLENNAHINQVPGSI